MKGGRGRKKPIRPETWSGYMVAEFHRLMDLGLAKKWNLVLDQSERPENPNDWDEGIMEQVVAEVWERE